MNVIETYEVTKTFNHKLAVDRVSLSVPKGSIYGILGANGAGKSTLLRLLVGLFRPSSGQVHVFGEPIQQDSTKLYERVHYIASDVGMYTDLRVGEMLKTARSLYPRWNKKRADRLIEEFRLPERQVIRNLSTGTRTQLRIAIAMSTMPELLVLDEATNGLDPLVKHQVVQLLIEAAATDDLTIVFATHQLDEIERMADHVAMMTNGRIVAAESLDDMRARFREVQLISEADISQTLLTRSEVRRVRRHGEHWSVVIDNGPDEWVRRFEQIGAEHIVVHELDLTEMFRVFMESEGYQRDRIHLP